MNPFFMLLICITNHLQGFWSGASFKGPTSQSRRCKRCGLDPWVRKILWRRAWQPAPVFLPGESHGQRSLVGYTPWGPKESDTTEVTWHAHTVLLNSYNSLWEKLSTVFRYCLAKKDERLKPELDQQNPQFPSRLWMRSKPLGFRSGLWCSFVFSNDWWNAVL